MFPITKFFIPLKIWNLLTSAERRNVVGLLGLMLIGMVLETLSIGMVIPSITLLTKSDFIHNYPIFQRVLQVLGNPSQKMVVIGGMLVLVGVYFIKGLFLVLLASRQMRFAFGLQAQTSLRLFTIYLRQPYSFHLQRNSAQLIQNVITVVDVFTFSGILQSMLLINEILVLFSLSVLMLVVEPFGALIVASALGTAAWGFHSYTRRRIMRWGKAHQYHEGLRIQHLQQGLGGAKDVKILGRETDFLEKYQVHNMQFARMGQLQSVMQQLPRLWLELLAVCGLAILVISMLWQGRALEGVFATVCLFAAAAFRLMPSVNRVISAVQSLTFCRPIIDTLHTELKLTTTSEVGSTYGSFTPFCTVLELKQVTYSYMGAARQALKDISLVVQRGESVGFIGASGSGKSTLVDIILGLFTPDTGEVLVDGKNIRINLRNWQDQIGYVPQSIFLTDDTLRRNVAFGLSDNQINDAAVYRAIHAAQLDEFVDSLPNKLETFVGERGIRLSGGQRQRIGIARALYHDPTVLVLDEATSSLDIATEHEVMQAVRALQSSKTVLIVAHRLSTLEYCDRLYRLKQGQIVEEGTPKTMISNQLKDDIITEQESSFKPLTQENYVKR